MRFGFARLLLVLMMAWLAGCAGRGSGEGTPGSSPGLAGAWRSSVQFNTGPLAAVKDLEFLYVFNAGGTMTESSNYDGAPPVPPAYGIWRALGPREFEARYEFYATRPPASVTDITGGGGWLPAGRGVLTERMALSEDGRSFTSTIRYEALDPLGKPAPGGSEGTGRGARIEF
jgi:hypothetical protein